MHYKQFYKPGILDSMHQVQLWHLLNKYEGNVGIMEITHVGGSVMRRPVNDKLTIVKAMEYWNENSEQNPKAIWYYTKDISERINHDYEKITEEIRVGGS